MNELLAPVERNRDAGTGTARWTQGARNHRSRRERFQTRILEGGIGREGGRLLTWSSGAEAAAADERGDREETLDGEVASRGLGTSGVVPF